MNKFKDFFYNKNDIFTVLIIVAVAAFIIYTRIDVIMAYPEKLANEISKKEATQEVSPSPETTTDEIKTTEDEAKKNDSQEEISFTISDGDSSVSVSTKLFEAGLITSDTEFQNYISNMDKESSLKSGTYTIKKGLSNEEVLNILTT